MIYFDMLGPIRVLPDEDKGRLLVAMLEYGQSGTVPEFDGMLALAWGFVKPKLDRDGETYENAKVQRKYAAFCKRRTALNLPKVPFDEWINLSDNERERMVTNDNEPLRAVDFVGSRYPTTTTSTSISPSTSTITSTSTTAAAAVSTTETDDLAAAADRKVKVLGGELGKNVVFLSDEQFDDLLDKMDLETFNYYVEKLANFIIKNGAHVKNHYETLLKWWREDSVVHKHRSHKKEVPKGASGELGQAELEAIQRILAETE
jgi:hypothetical protein